MQQLHYLELSNDPIRFESVSQLTSVFFDDSNKQVFAVRSGGATGVVVKGPREIDTISFLMSDKGPIRSIKFSPDNQILAIQRHENNVEFISCNFSSSSTTTVTATTTTTSTTSGGGSGGGSGAPSSPSLNHQPHLQELFCHKGKPNTEIFGFVWIHTREVAFISNVGIELFTINVEKKQMKSTKSINMTINWFSWCAKNNLAILATQNGQTIWPVLLKQNVITKLPKLQWEFDREIPERDVTLAQIYGVAAILLLRPTANRLMDVIVYLLNGPGLAPKKSHILRLGINGRFAINIVDDLIVVHHQSSKTSLLFDIALTTAQIGTENSIPVHTSITTPKSIKPFTLNMPSLSFAGETKNCELYSTNWVLFQPNIVIDAKLGCMWCLSLKLDSLCSLITNPVCLVEFLLQRTNGKLVLLNVLKSLLTVQYNETLLPVLETIFDKLNAVYAIIVDAELQTQIALPMSTKQSKIRPASSPSSNSQPSDSYTNCGGGGVNLNPSLPRVVIDQSDMYQIFSSINDKQYIGAILMIYLSSLLKHNISAQHELSKILIVDLVQNNHWESLRKLIEFSLLNESKVLACFLLSLSNVHSSIIQMALDMLRKLNADSIIVEVLLGQGKIIDSLRLAKTLPFAETISARKFLEAAAKCKDPIVFYSVYSYFVERNTKNRGSPDFLESELCSEYIELYRTLFCH